MHVKSCTCLLSCHPQPKPALLALTLSLCYFFVITLSLLCQYFVIILKLLCHYFVITLSLLYQYFVIFGHLTFSCLQISTSFLSVPWNCLSPDSYITFLILMLFTFEPVTHCPNSLKFNLFFLTKPLTEVFFHRHALVQRVPSDTFLRRLLNPAGRRTLQPFFGPATKTLFLLAIPKLPGQPQHLKQNILCICSKNRPPTKYSLK